MVLILGFGLPKGITKTLVLWSGLNVYSVFTSVAKSSQVQRGEWMEKINTSKPRYEQITTLRNSNNGKQKSGSNTTNWEVNSISSALMVWNPWNKLFKSNLEPVRCPGATKSMPICSTKSLDKFFGIQKTLMVTFKKRWCRLLLTLETSLKPLEM